MPSFDPTVLKYPAENPPVKAPCNRLRPFSSRTWYNLISHSCAKRLSREYELLASTVGRTLQYPWISLTGVKASLSGQLVDSRAFEIRCRGTYETEGFIRLGTGGVDAEIVELPLQSARHGC